MNKKENILDCVVLNIEGNSWTYRDACTGTIVFGMTGSGKSSGPLHAIAKRFIEDVCGGVVFCAKPDESETWIKYAKESNRENDLLFLSKETFNYLDHEAKRTGRGGGQIENMVNLYFEICQMGKDKKSGSSNDQYWENAVKQMLRNSMTILHMAGETINIENIYKLIISAPKQNAGGSITAEGESYFHTLFSFSISGEDQKKPEFELARSYFYEEFAVLDQRTKTNTISSFTVTADAMQRGELSRCFSAKESTLNLEDLYRKGKILIVDYDVKSWGRAGQYAAAIIKYCFEMMIERREDLTQDDARPVFLWADECQFFSIDYDQKFQTTARSSRTLTVYATQNLGNLHDGYGKEKAASLIGNLGTKFFCQNGEYETNEWAAKSIGQEIIIRKSQNFGDSHSSSVRGDGNMSNSYSENFSEQKDYRVDPSTFSTLQTGGPRGQCKVGFVFWQSGRVLVNKNVYVKSTIAQECRMICGAHSKRACPRVVEIGKGVYLGENHVFVASDFFVLSVFLLTSLLPLIALYLLYYNKDSQIVYIPYGFDINVSTILFFLTGIPIFFLVLFLYRLPIILKCLITKQSRPKERHVKGLVANDMGFIFCFICIGFGYWMQNSLYTLKDFLIVLVLWFVATIVFRFLFITGGRSVAMKE